MIRPFLSLDQARAMLTAVRQLTRAAVLRADALAAELQRVADADPAHANLSDALRDVVNGCADAVRAPGVEVKGWWLVDFDNGEGYYCRPGNQRRGARQVEV